MTIPALHHRLSDDLERMHRWCDEGLRELDAMKKLAKDGDECRGALEEAIGYLNSVKRAISRAEVGVERRPG